MKNIFYILLLLPTIIFAQYPSNSGQKITLGEQTTADGLVFRGVANIDTVTATSKITRANKQDTSAFILLDTVTNLLWHYKTASNRWIQAGGSTFDTTTLNLVSRFALKLNIADTSSMLTNYYRSGRALGTPTSGTLTNATGLPLTTGVTGTLLVANGGTGSATQNFVDLTTTQSVGGAKTFTSAVTATRFNPTANTATGTGMFLPATNELGFSVLDSTRFFIKPFNTTSQVGNTLIGVNTTSPSSLGGGYSSIDVRGTGGAGFILGSKSNAQSLMYSSAAQTIFQTLNSAAFSILIIDTVGVDAERYAFNANRLGQVGIAGISVAGISEALHVNGNGRFTGNIGIGSATPTTSGTGITFPATQSASTNVNTLDDYEEGTWTPVVNGYITNPTMTYLFQTATYTKVGRLVTFELLVRGARVSGGSGRIYIKGLPFTSAEVYGYATSVNNSNIPTTLPTVGTVVNSDTGILFYTSTFSNTDVTNWCSDCFIYASGYYHTN